MTRKLFFKWLRYFVLFRLMSLLPMGLAYRAAAIVGRIDAQLNRNAGASYQQGLAQVFPDKSAKELDLLWREHCGVMAREIMDIFCLPRMARGNLANMFDLHGLDAIADARREGRGVILATAHFSRPTMVCAGLGLSGEKNGMLTQIIDARNPHLDAVDRSYLKLKMKHTVEASGGRWVTLGESMRSLYSGLKAGEIITILFDLYESNPNNILQAPFFGGLLRIPRGIERIAAKTGARIVYSVALDQGKKVRIELRELPDHPQQALLAAVVEVEKDITKVPGQWWQWGILEHIWNPPEKP